MDTFERYYKKFPSFYNIMNNTVIKSIIETISDTDEGIKGQILEAQDQLFSSAADGQYLDYIGNSYDIERAGMYDNVYREVIGIKTYTPKQIKSTIYRLLEAFFTPLYSRTNITCQNPENYDLSDSGSRIISKSNISAQQYSNIVSGNLSGVVPGSWMKFTYLDSNHWVRVEDTISSSQIVLSAQYPYESVISSVEFYNPMNIAFTIDENDEFDIYINPNNINDLSSASASEIVNSLNINGENFTFSSVIDISENTTNVNLRTNTLGALGKVQVTGGSLNSVLNFSVALIEFKDIVDRIEIYEVRDGEISISIPTEVVYLTASEYAAHHFEDIEESDGDADDYVKLLIEADDGYIADGSKNLDYIINKGIVTDSSIYKFGNGSLKFDNPNKYLVWPYSGNMDFSGDMTIDFWFRFPELGSFSYVESTLLSAFGENGKGIWVFFQKESGAYKLYVAMIDEDGTIRPSSSMTIVPDTWYHLAITKQWSDPNGVVRTYLNGTLRHTNTHANNQIDLIGLTKGLYIGTDSRNIKNGHFYGYIDEFVVSNGIRRWTSNFTAPTSQQWTPYVYHISETCNPSNLFENSNTNIYRYANSEDYGYTLDFITQTTLNTAISESSSVSKILVSDASNFPNSGKIVVNFGNNNSEGWIPYLYKENNITLVIDSEYIFKKDHDIGETVFIMNFDALDLIESDYPVSIWDTSIDIDLVKSLIDDIKASGVKIKWLLSDINYRY